jgi:hypothetical protein
MEFVYTPNFTAPLNEGELSELDERGKKADEKNGNNNTSSFFNSMKNDVGKKRTQEEKRELKLSTEFTDPQPMTAEQIAESKKKLDTIDEIDLTRIKTMEKRNALETLLYNKKEWIDSEESKKYSKEGEIETALAKTKDISEWYEDEGYNADLTTLEKKFDELNKAFNEFEYRQKKHKNRVRSSEALLNELNKSAVEGANLVKTKPWIENHFNNTFMKELESVQNWYKEMSEKQDAIALHEEAVLTSELIDAKLSIVKREYWTMARIPKPKPTPTEANIKYEDLLKNGTYNFTNLEDLIVSY